MNREDWLMLLLGTPEEDGRPAPPMDRVRIIKCLFVLEKRFPSVAEGGYYHFTPYNYGPFDSSVYSDAEELARQGDVEIIPGRYVKYMATEDGRRRAEDLQDGVPTAVRKYLLELRRWANRVDFSTLVKAIYQEWPEQRARSVFKG